MGRWAACPGETPPARQGTFHYGPPRGPDTPGEGRHRNRELSPTPALRTLALGSAWPSPVAGWPEGAASRSGVSPTRVKSTHRLCNLGPVTDSLNLSFPLSKGRAWQRSEDSMRCRIVRRRVQPRRPAPLTVPLQVGVGKRFPLSQNPPQSASFDVTV